jgi:organic hydroperoxide reductase OsmC/OhrA
MNILYTTEAVVEGGRAGHGRTSDGRLAVELSVPKEIGVSLDSPAQREA